MKWLSNFLHTSVGRKQLMALTGLLLSIFLILHLSGNLLLLVNDGGEKFNAYAQGLANLGILKVIGEIALASLFLAHIWLALLLTSQNRKARNSPYYYKHASDAGLASRTMIYSGVLITLFLIIHLFDFTLTDHHVPGGLYAIVEARLSSPFGGCLYILSMTVLFFHLSHGIQSFLQSFGIFHPKHTPNIKKMCLGLALVLSLGFATIPLYFMINAGGV